MKWQKHRTRDDRWVGVDAPESVVVHKVSMDSREWWALTCTDLDLFHHRLEAETIEEALVEAEDIIRDQVMPWVEWAGPVEAGEG